ncbi:hypothetical protein GCM10009547_37420 [Sporichthya brevicatena]|uniref:PknH-like extracellular domain-containing protein n=1 Tax=Sporichthya brevicatena TaxID=171442 RepID=A0ABP3SA32_9ACTN
MSGRRGRRNSRAVARVVAPATALLLALSACGDDASEGAALPPEAPAAEPTVPATAGPLSERQLPDPAVLGDGWTERADPGDGHGDGHSDGRGDTAGDGPSTQQRDVDELMDGLAPIGCPDRAVAITLPRPRYALERTYAGPAGQPGVALVLEFADSAGPRTFLDRFERQMRACPAGAADPDGPIVLGYRSVDRAPERVSGLRQETGFEADPNRYLVVAVRDGKRVGLVYLSGVPAAKAAAIGPDLIRAIRAT